MKKHHRGLIGLSLVLSAFLFLAVAPTSAQEAATQAAAVAEPIDEPIDEPVGVDVTPSQATIQVSGSATASKTGLSGTETVAFSGNVVINASVVTDPALPTGVTLFIDCKGLQGAGNETRTAYITSCEANVTRLFRPKDRITLTFAFFENKTDSVLDAKTGQVTLDLTYDEAAKTLTSATGVVATFDATETKTPTEPATGTTSGSL